MATGFGAKLYGADVSPQELVTCVHLVGDSVALGKGDIVKRVTGSLSIGNGPVVLAVAQAATGDRVWGVVVSCERHTVVTGLSLDGTHCPASTAMYVLVRPIKTGEEYVMMEDGVGGVIASTSIGNNANFIVAVPNATTGMSGTMLDSSTATTTNTLDLKIVGVVNDAANLAGLGAAATGAKFIVTFNKVDGDQIAGV